MANLVGFSLAGTDIRAENIEVAMRFNIAVEDRMMDLLKREIPAERIAELEREAAMQKAAERRLRQGQRRLVAWYSSMMDCGEVGCGLCRVCKHYAFEDWASSVAPRDIPHSVIYDKDVVNYINRNSTR